MKHIPTIQCPCCQELSRLTDFVHKEDILNDAELGYCPKCNHPIHLNITYSVFAYPTAVESHLEYLHKQLDEWTQAQSKQVDDIKLVKHQIKFYKEQIKIWTKVCQKHKIQLK